MRKNRISTGVFIKENINVASVGSNVNTVLALVYQSVMMTLGVYSILGCFLSCFNIDVDYRLVIAGVFVIEALLLMMSVIKKVLWFYMGTLCLAIIVVLLRWKYIKYGIFYISNEVVRKFNAYVGTNISQQSVRLKEDYCVAWVLVLLSFLLLSMLWCVIYKAKFKMAYYLFAAIIILPSFISNTVIGMFPLMCLIIHIISIAVMNKIPRGVTEGTELKPEPGRNVLNSFKVKTRIYNGAFSLLLLSALLLCSPLLFSRGAYESLDVPEKKAAIQQGINDFSMQDVLDSTRDLFNKLSKSNFNPLNIFKNKSSGGLRGGELNLEEEVVFTYETAIEATLPRTVNSIYLKGYSGVNYTGKKWETLNKEEQNQYNAIFERYGENYEGQALPWHFMELVARSNISNNLISSSTVNPLFGRYNIKLSYREADNEYIYAPYDCILDTSDNFFLVDDLYITPIDTYDEYKLEYYMPTDDLRTMLTRGFNPDIETQKGWKEYLDFEKEYREFVYDVYTMMPSGLSRLKNLRLKSGNDTFEKIDAVRKYLSENTKYTLAPGKLPDDKDYVEYFLFDNKKGYCAHYASAAVLMLRNMGVPARYAEGYMLSSADIASGKITGWGKVGMYGEAGNKLNSSMEEVVVEIKDSNAHAWIEVYLDGYGWYPVEVTAGNSYSSQIGAEKYRPPVTQITPVPTATPAPTGANISGIPTISAAPTPTLPVKPTGKPEVTSQPVPNTWNPWHDETEKELFTWWSFILYLIAAVIAVFIVISVRQRIILMIRKRKEMRMNTEERALYYCKMMFRLLDEFGIDTSVKTGYERFIEDLTSRLVEKRLLSLNNQNFVKGLKALVKTRFSEEKLTEEEAEHIYAAYQSIRKSCYELTDAYQGFVMRCIKIL